jgi:hypothetical protein
MKANREKFELQPLISTSEVVAVVTSRDVVDVIGVEVVDAPVDVADIVEPVVDEDTDEEDEEDEEDVVEGGSTCVS